MLKKVNKYDKQLEVVKSSLVIITVVVVVVGKIDMIVFKTQLILNSYK